MQSGWVDAMRVKSARGGGRARSCSSRILAPNGAGFSSCSRHIILPSPSARPPAFWLFSFSFCFFSSLSLVVLWWCLWCGGWDTRLDTHSTVLLAAASGFSSHRTAGGKKKGVHVMRSQVLHFCEERGVAGSALGRRTRQDSGGDHPA